VLISRSITLRWSTSRRKSNCRLVLGYPRWIGIGPVPHRRWLLIEQSSALSLTHRPQPALLAAEGKSA
jgi:hypothetical protein